MLLLIAQAHGADIRLQLDGLNGDLKRNVLAHLSSVRLDKVTTDFRFQNRVDNAIRIGLRALGYYSPTINFVFKSAINNRGRDVLIAKITPGKPIKIADVHIILRGDAKKDIDYWQWITNGKPTIGTILNHGEYNKFKRGFSRLALRKGYFDAKFHKSQLSVSPTRYQAYWDIDFDSGQRYRFGEVRFHSAQIRKDYLKNLIKIREGEPYRTEILTDLNRQLVATNWFNSVVISPDFTNSKQSKILPIDAIVTPRIRNNIEIGIGYTTDMGPRIKTSWNKPWLNSCGHSLQTSLSLLELEKSVYISYKIPMSKDPLEQYYLLQSGFKRADFNDTQVDLATLHIARYWDMSRGWQRAINLRWSLDYFNQDKITNTTMLIYPGISVNRTRQRGRLMPSWGDNQYYSINISNTLWRSNVNFIILQARNVWIRTLSEKHRFIARSNLGWIETDNFKSVPLSQRFFAGGDRSIRGYKYKSLSPRDDKGKLLTGASKLATGSLEYQYNIISEWWGVMFIDSGEAINNIKKSNIKTGAGIGMRWQSPIGCIKWNIAFPVADEKEHGAQFYIGLGPEL